MGLNNIDEQLEPLLEDLSDMVHQQWMAWSKGLCEEGELISKKRCERWESYWVDYKDLPEKVKDIDRDIAQRYMSVVLKHCLCL